MLVEVCAESVGSILVAERAGAVRVEFCDNMAEGGTTPSAGSILVARELSALQLYPIIRPRGGDFVFTEEEFAIMRRDVEFCGRSGCDGVVVGILDAKGCVDMVRCGELAAIAGSFGMGVAFHRAFDVSRDLGQSLEDVIALGCERILTSGGAATALEGVDVIRDLVVRAAGRITIMAGSGVTSENAPEIVARTGVTEIHGTFRSRVESASVRPAWAEYSRWAADEDKIRKVVAL